MGRNTDAIARRQSLGIVVRDPNFQRGAIKSIEVVR
jgi:hypothetical protein